MRTALIKNGKSEITTIYCILSGILLSLQLQEQQIGWNIAVNTSTTTLLDDLEPLTDEADYEIQKRNNSALKVRLFRCERRYVLHNRSDSSPVGTDSFRDLDKSRVSSQGNTKIGCNSSFR